MPPKKINNEIQVDELMLQKLSDIESLLSIRVEQGQGDKESLELANQLLAKVTGSIDKMQNMKLQLEGVETVTLKGKDGEDGDDGDDCDPQEVAKILMQSEEFLQTVKGPKGDSVKGDPGEPGKNADPYELTDKDKKKMCETVCEEVEGEMPDMVKKAVKEYVTSERLTKEINAVLKKKKITTKDVEGLSELLKKEIDAVYEGVSSFVSSKMSGGGSLLLNALNDVDTKLIADGYTLKWDAKKKLFYFGAGGSGGGGSSTDIINVLETKTDNYTLVATDFGKTLVMDSASNKAFTLPTTVAGNVGAKITFVKTNTGKVTLQMPASTTIADSNAAGTMFNDLTNETWASVTIQLVTATKWVVVGGFGTWITT